MSIEQHHDHLFLARDSPSSIGIRFLPVFLLLHFTFFADTAGIHIKCNIFCCCCCCILIKCIYSIHIDFFFHFYILNNDNHNRASIFLYNYLLARKKKKRKTWSFGIETSSKSINIIYAIRTSIGRRQY